MVRYVPSRNYAILGVASFCLAVGSVGIAATRFPFAYLAAGLFLATAALNLYLALRPVIEISPDSIAIGDYEYLWSEISRVERTGWVSPLVLWLIFKDDTRKLVIYPGALDGSRRLAADIHQKLTKARERMSRTVTVGASGASPIAAGKKRAPLLNPADEADIERMFQKLKTAGRLDTDD